MNRPVRVHPSLTESRLSVYWTDTAASPHQAPRLSTSADADLVIVGGGYTGLWCAIQALEDEPGRRVTVLEADSCGDGASSRNGGFCHASLTHGLENGLRHWPNEIETLTALGRANLDGVEETLVRHGIDASFERTGELVVATEPWQLAGLERGSEIADRFGYTSTVLHSAEVRRLLDSPTYLGGLVVPEDVAMVDPARLCWGLRHIAENLGATIHEGSRVSRLERSGKGLVLTTAEASVRCDKVIVATNAYRSPVRRARKYSIPVYDHVLMTEPLSSGQMASIGWQGRQGFGDSGQQFHYYRLTDDNRILWGGYDATYHWSSRIDPSLDDRPETHNKLAHHFFETFPQLEGLTFTHRWGGPIATTTRFTAAWGIGSRGDVAWVGGYTGLGIGASRFGARVALDLVDGRDTERTALSMVQKPPIPFPPEPLRSFGVSVTKRAIQRQDRRGGRQGAWLSLLNRFGVGFSS